jgi:O-antigen ligase/Tfp pilus assembly protein PilF
VTTTPRRLLAWGVILLAGIWFTTVGGVFGALSSAPIQIVSQVVGYVVIGGWLIVALAQPDWRPRTDLFPAILVAVVALGISFWFSPRPRLSLEPTFAGVAYALAYLFLSRLTADRWFRRRLGVTAVVGVGLIGGAYIIEVVREWITWWGLVGRFAMPPLRPSFVGLYFSSPNLVATFLIIIGPLAVAIAATTRRRAIAVALAFLAGLAVLLAGSRGAYLGCALGAVAGVALLAIRPGAWHSVASAFARVPAWARIGGLGLAVLAAAALIPALAYRFAQGGESIRADLWRSAISIFLDHPLSGGGPGTWAQLKIGANPPGTPNVILPHAHNLYLQTAAELGIVGLGALALVVALVALRLLRVWRGADPRTATHAAGAIVGLAAFGGQALVDNVANLPFVCLLVLFGVAWVDGGAAPATADGATAEGQGIWSRVGRLEGHRFLPIVALVSMGLAISMLGRIDTARLASSRGSDAAFAGDWPTALARYTEAALADPAFAYYRIQMASALARLDRASQARTELLAVTEQDPLAVNLVSLATLDLAAGDAAAARTHADRAMELGIGEPTVALTAGVVEEQAGDPSLALQRFATAIAWDPPLAGAKFWDDPARAASKAEVVELARSFSDPLTGALILAYAGDTEKAATELRAQPPSPTRELFLAVTAWRSGDAAGAQRALAERTNADPTDWQAAAWLARISRLSGEPTTADRYARWATIVQADVAPTVIFEASLAPVPPDHPAAAAAGVPPAYPWSVYARPFTPHMLAPDVTLVGVR